MALVKETLKKNISDKIKKTEKKLNDALNSKIDGIYAIQENLDKILSANIPSKNFNAEKYKKKLWETISKEWSNKLSKQIITVLAEDLSTIISDEIDKYIKSANIIIPSGIAVTTAGTAAAQTGATVAPSSPAQIN